MVKLGNYYEKNGGLQCILTLHLNYVEFELP